MVNSLTRTNSLTFRSSSALPQRELVTLDGSHEAEFCQARNGRLGLSLNPIRCTPSSTSSTRYRYSMVSLHSPHSTRTIASSPAPATSKLRAQFILCAVRQAVSRMEDDSPTLRKTDCLCGEVVEHLISERHRSLRRFCARAPADRIERWNCVWVERRSGAKRAARACRAYGHRPHWQCSTP
jgi:hypothetical protein